MAGKVTGLGATITVDDASSTPRDISTDVSDYQMSTPYGVQEVTGVDKFAIERLLLLQDHSVTFNGTFDPDANKSHAVFSGDKRVTRTVVVLAGTSTLTTEDYFSDYQIKRSNTGQLTWTAPGALANGVAPAWS